MSWRTTEEAVKIILGDNYDDSSSLEGFIETAKVMTDEMVTCAASRGVSHSAALLERIEAYLAAHFYGHADQFYTEKKTGDADAVFQGKTEMGLQSTQYGQTAISLDKSGCLMTFSKGAPRVGVAWLGKAPSNQTDYADRN